MRIDLHTHSLVSDGTQTPSELVAAAVRADLDVVALTDHDTTAGWSEAASAAAEQGIRLVRGIEVSTKHLGQGVHLLAYLPDPEHPELVEMLGRIRDGRGDRLPQMLAQLQSAGVAIDADDVRRVNTGTTSTGRPHVADALIAAGVVADRTEAFERFLNPGRPGYVDRYAAPLVEMIGIVERAGGVSVIAHPWGRHGLGSPSVEEIGRLATAGLGGIEVDHQDHSAQARDQLRGLAADLDLVATGSSDHHGTGKVDHDLGCNTTAPDQFERLLERARSAARRSGREATAVLG